MGYSEHGGGLWRPGDVARLEKEKQKIAIIKWKRNKKRKETTVWGVFRAEGTVLTTLWLLRPGDVAHPKQKTTDCGALVT